MKKLLSLALLLLLPSCIFSKIGVKNNENPQYDYGVFLGAEDNKKTLNKLLQYKEVAIEIEEFSESTLSKLKEKNIIIDAYISVGSLESYKPYYNDFAQYTFMDYDNWPDERWIDVSVSPYQDKLVELATNFISLGADTLFLDNYDVYYIAVEEYKERNIKEQIFNGLCTITNRLYDLGAKLMLNSGLDFLERLNDESNPILDKIHALNQESVFSSIEDYDNNVFGRQSNEEHNYYIDLIETFDDYGLDIYLLEYTKDSDLINEIVTYCNSKSYKYFISEDVDLK